MARLFFLQDSEFFEQVWCPLRLREIWPWMIAACAFDHGDADPLRVLLGADMVIPDEMRPMLASIVSGERRPNAKAKTKCVIPPAERFVIGARVTLGIRTLETFQKPIVELDGMQLGLEVAIDNRRQNGSQDLEVIDVFRDLQRQSRDLYAEFARRHRVSIPTIKALGRDFRERVTRFPVV